MRIALSAAFLLLLASPLRADEAPAAQGATVLSVDGGASSITYTMVHKLHKFSGVSRKVEGKGRLLPDGKAQVMVRAPVESFDSQNANRDAHMKETVEAARYPQVELKAAGADLKAPASFPATVEKTFQGELTFHGQKQAVSVPAKLTFESADRVRVTAKFNISLDAYKIERPSLLFVKVDDAAQIDVNLVFKK